MADRSHRQRHVGLAVAYNVWQYWQASGDTDFMARHGAELLVEVARFFATTAEFDEADGRWRIDGVMGPDEFHDGYPDRAEPGLRDNTYRNVLTSWLLWRAADTVAALAYHHCGELWDRLGLAEEELGRWARISRGLAVPTAADGRLSPFAGYEDLAELDWEAYPARYGNIGRLDLILAAEGDTTNRYKVSKQADVLMLATCSPRPSSPLCSSDSASPSNRPRSPPPSSTTWPAPTADGRTRCCETPSEQTWTTPRAGPPPRASTSGPWPQRSTLSNAATSASSCATRPSGSTPACPPSWAPSGPSSSTGVSGSTPTPPRTGCDCGSPPAVPGPCGSASPERCAPSAPATPSTWPRSPSAPTVGDAVAPVPARADGGDAPHDSGQPEKLPWSKAGGLVTATQPTTSDPGPRSVPAPAPPDTTAAGPEPWNCSAQADPSFLSAKGGCPRRRRKRKRQRSEQNRCTVPSAPCSWWGVPAGTGIPHSGSISSASSGVPPVRR